MPIYAYRCTECGFEKDVMRKVSDPLLTTIVAVDHIKELQPLFYGEYSVMLLDGTKLTMSRSYREKVFQRLMKDQQPG